MKERRKDIKKERKKERKKEVKRETKKERGKYSLTFLFFIFLISVFFMFLFWMTFHFHEKYRSLFIFSTDIFLSTRIVLILVLLRRTNKKISSSLKDFLSTDPIKDPIKDPIVS